MGLIIRKGRCVFFNRFQELDRASSHANFAVHSSRLEHSPVDGVIVDEQNPQRLLGGHAAPPHAMPGWIPRLSGGVLLEVISQLDAHAMDDL